ncbi:hypothetical protein GTO89_16555 [Heliobacterium gestii]|uniref:Uncharacterized protein n=1 Tax=Heliomicrobium gestii TaxID=2699 RepID=A0A845LGT6_HELGE|nr:hypothetical protein [Heliomicrobium gestii]MBM7867319.1 hypothetical protein [Heliomicrobium gestii]MZP44634.1 hypothetical protein [Heliomicrobium gestii]
MSIDELAANIADHKLNPYGTYPLFEKTIVNGQEARIIRPSADQTEKDLSACITHLQHPTPGCFYFFNGNRIHLKELPISCRIILLKVT